jgi:hypothetical protein
MRLSLIAVTTLLAMPSSLKDPEPSHEPGSVVSSGKEQPAQDSLPNSGGKNETKREKMPSSLR